MPMHCLVLFVLLMVKVALPCMYILLYYVLCHALFLKWVCILESWSYTTVYILKYYFASVSAQDTKYECQRCTPLNHHNKKFTVSIHEFYTQPFLVNVLLRMFKNSQ